MPRFKQERIHERSRPEAVSCMAAAQPASAASARPPHQATSPPAGVAARIRPQGSDKLYIARTQLQKDDKLVDQEGRIEAVMRKAGYDVFHPERHSIADQLSRYMTAKTIVGAEGSAFHLAPFAMPTGGRAALFQRRYYTRAFNAYPRQLEAFCEAEVTSLRPLVPRKANSKPSEESPALDFDALMDGLSDAGFI